MSSECKRGPKLDLYQNRKWLHTISGFRESRSLLYIAHISLIYTILVYLLVMAVYACNLVVSDKVLVVSAAHMIMIVVFTMIVISSRLMASKSINETNQMIISGIYVYREEMDEEYLNMQTRIEEEYKRLAKFYTTLFASGGITNLTLFPITQLLVEHNETGIFNPYLPPYFIYMPFDTRNPLGYCLAYVINVVLVITLYGIVCSWLEMYIHCTIQLKFHLRFLNSSIRNVEQRAVVKYLKSNKGSNCELSYELLYKHQHFQACIYSCLRSNIQHHQALLKFRRALQPFHGAGMLDLYLMSALIYATVLYLIFQKLPINYIINLAVMLVAEQSNLLIICLLGEAVKEESANLSESLHQMTWIQCNKRINTAVSIMVSKVQTPINIEASLIGKAADIKTYAEFMSAMYKIMNLWRQSDTTNPT